MVLEQTSGGWTAAEGDPAVTSDVSLIEAASQTGLDQTESRPANIVFQTLLVLAAAMFAGFLVFFAVRAAVSSDAAPDEQAMDLNELPSVGLDPDNRDGSVSSDEGSSRSGSQRDTLEDGIPEEETPAATPTDAADNNSQDTASEDSSTAGETADSGDAESDGPGGSDGLDSTSAEDSTAGDAADAADESPGFGELLGPIASTSTTTPAAPSPSILQPPGLPSLPTTAAPAPTTTPITATPTTQTTSAPPTTSQPTTTPLPTTATTASTTTATTPTTTGVTTTTIGSTTTTSIATGTTLAAPSLIRAPIEGSEHTWETGVQFEAEETSDAVRYCWKLESANKDVEECSADTGYTLPGGEAGVDPGIVIVTAEAQDAGGAVLSSEVMTLKVIARELIDSPSAGRDYDQGDDVRVDFVEIPTVTEYCVTLTQGAITLPPVCDTDDRVSVPLRRFTDGPVTVLAEAMRGQQIIGVETIEVVYNE